MVRSGIVGLALLGALLLAGWSTVATGAVTPPFATGDTVCGDHGEPGDDRDEQPKLQPNGNAD
jgi:hypothetical protein